MIREGKKCAIYIRVSTEMQVDGYSLEAQKSVLKRYADREGMIISEIYEDAGKSGKSIEGRPSFQKMLLDIKEGLDVDYILVYKLSRFGRNAADILSSLEVIQSYDVNLICAEEGIDSSQTSGRLLISVLSAVAEIERENIIEQTMNGRKEKARQGKWNGGFAPYGYSLERIGNNEKKELVIAEDEAEVIKIIFDKFVNTDMGINGVAKYLNLQGINKKVRQNGKLDMWSSSLIKKVLDNPIYMGKIAYGRRTREKIKGSKETKQVYTDNYILVDGQHEAIVSPEVWEQARIKRELTGVKQPSAIGRERTHLLSGILKCPKCGMPMYTNRNSWTSKSTGYHELYYYVCSNKRSTRGRKCDYTKQIREELVENEVVSAISELVDNPTFAKEIKKRIGTKIDTEEIDKEIVNYTTKLKEVESSKRRLEMTIDALSPDTKFYDRKLQDMNYRLDNLYDTICELEEKIDDAQIRRKSVEMQAITLDNVYKILKNFNKVFDRLTDDEKRTVISSFIKEIQVFEKDSAPQNLKSITFNFPIFVDGEEVNQILWENENTVETCVLLSHKKSDSHIEVTMDFNDLKIPNKKEKVTYKKIQTYIEDKYKFKVHTAYIAEVKRSFGLEMYDAPNAVEVLKNPRKHPTPEKVEAIKDALKYFEIIT